MELIPLLLKEMDNEAKTTRKMLERIPDDTFDWKPHEKSMTIRSLATHIAELPTWVSTVVNTTELDFATGEYNPAQLNNTQELLAYFEKCFTDGRAHLEKVTEEELLPNWTLRNGEEIYSVSPKHEVIRMAFCQVVHHRAQLGVYLRLLNIPIPGSYGPSADDPGF